MVLFRGELFWIFHKVWKFRCEWAVIMRRDVLYFLLFETQTLLANASCVCMLALYLICLNCYCLVPESNSNSSRNQMFNIKQ